MLYNQINTGNLIQNKKILLYRGRIIMKKGNQCDEYQKINRDNQPRHLAVTLNNYLNKGMSMMAGMTHQRI